MTGVEPKNLQGLNSKGLDSGETIPTAHNPSVLGDGHRRTNIRMVGVRESAVRVSRARLAFAAAVFAVLFLSLGVRLVALAIDTGGGEPINRRAAVASPAHVERADIVDRNGILLATNLITSSLYANPKQIFDARSVAKRLAAVLPDKSETALYAKLILKREFVWLQRNLTPRLKAEIFKMAIPGVWFQPEQRRVYPHGPTAAHLLGFTDIDNRGLAGIEQYFDKEMSVLARQGSALELSIDIRVQHALREELQRAVTKFKAIGAAGVILDANSGELLAMVSLPDFDPNHPGKTAKSHRFNRATKGVYELGSVFKAFTVAMALDTGTVSLSSSYDARYPIKISRFTIRDSHPKARWLSVSEIFMYSSNIGAAKMAIDVGGVRQREFLRRIGMLRRPTLELPEVGAPLSPVNWRDIYTMTIAFGHGLAVSPLQLAAGIGAVVNGGVLYPTTLVKQDKAAPRLGDRVLSERTSGIMRGLLRLVVKKGTGRKADIAGYQIGGKTGTAEKAGPRGYRRRALLTSFVAAFPMSKPRYVVYTLLDEPKGIPETHGFAGAGWTAAPTAGRIIARIAPLLGVHPVGPEAEEILARVSLAPRQRRTRVAIN